MNKNIVKNFAIWARKSLIKEVTDKLVLIGITKNEIKDSISKNLNKKVIISVYGLRNRVNRYEGIIYKIYPNLFTILINGEEKSFNYRDVITGEVKIKYL